MAFNGMSSVPSVSQRTLAITATQFSSFATPAITVPFPSVYAGQTQIPFAFSGTATWAATRVPTTIGGVAATAGVHSINSEASAAGYRTHDYGNGGGGGGWPTWATAVIAACGSAALILGILGLYCWRLRRKQKARKRAAAVYAHGDEGMKRRRMTKQGAAYTEKAVPARDSQRRSRAGVAAGSHPRSGRTSISPSQSRKRGPQYDYPPPIHTQLPDSPSNIRSRDLAALGISRPTSAAPSARRQREQDLASHPNAYPSDAPVYPQFAVPRSSRDFSGSSQNGLLAAGAPFAYQEGDTRLSRHSTPPPRAPNTAWGEYDSPGQNGSPAHLLARGDGYGSAEQDTPRSSLTMSTRGTGGAPYRWDQDPDLSSHMPDAGAVSAALGRAMLGPGSVAHEQPVGLAYGSPDDAHWANDSYGSSAHGYGGGYGQDLRRSTTPTYPPPASTSATSRAPSRQAQLDSGRASTYVPSHDGHRLQAPPGQQRSTTPLGEPFPSAAAGGAGVLGAPVAYGGGERAEHGRTDSAASASGRSRNYSRASTYETAAESDLEDDGSATSSRAYAR
ncbi:hypothetical protein JCM10449v2_004280 [Rhodotorula kratochvilovae]